MAIAIAVHLPEGHPVSWRPTSNSPSPKCTALSATTTISALSAADAKKLCPGATLSGTGLVDGQKVLSVNIGAGTALLEVPDADHHVMVDQPLAFADLLSGLVPGS